MERLAASIVTGILMPTCRRRIVRIVLVRQRSFVSCVSSRRKVWRKPCSHARASSSTLMTRLFRPVASTTSRHKKSRKSSWYVPRSLLWDFVTDIPNIQRSILEADQEEENEEAGDMNDDEINEIIARSDEEANFYRELDVQRERDALERWKAAGNRGKPPPPLITLEELPEFYRSDEPFAYKEDSEEVEGRGHRKRTIVNYNDGLSDDQWAMVSEGPPRAAIASNILSFRRSKMARIFKSSPSGLAQVKTSVPWARSSVKPSHGALPPLRATPLAAVARRRRASRSYLTFHSMLRRRTASGNEARGCL